MSATPYLYACPKAVTILFSLFDSVDAERFADSVCQSAYSDQCEVLYPTPRSVFSMSTSALGDF